MRVDTIIAPTKQKWKVSIRWPSFLECIAQIKDQSLPSSVDSVSSLPSFGSSWIVVSFEMRVELRFCVELMSKYMESRLKLEYCFRMFGHE